MFVLIFSHVNSSKHRNTLKPHYLFILGSVASFPRAKSNQDPESHTGSTSGGEFNLDLVERSEAGEAEEEKTARTEEEAEPPKIKLAPVNTEPQPWAEELELNWTTDLTRDDLLTLRDFFKQGMDFSVVEQVVRHALHNNIHVLSEILHIKLNKLICLYSMTE